MCSPTAGLVWRQIVEQVGKLNASFDSLVAAARDAVQDIRPEDFRQRVPQVENTDFINKDYVGFSSDDSSTYFMYDVEEMWYQLSNYWNYLNYGLLEHVIQQFGDGDLKQKMETYVNQLDGFKQSTKLCDFVQNHHNMLDHTKRLDELKQLVVKYERPDWACCTLSQVEMLKRLIVTKLYIPKEFLVDAKIPINGFVSVTWFIPPSVVSAMEGHLIDIPYEFFKNERITEITLDEHVYHSTELEPFAKELRTIYDIKVPGFLALQWPPPPTRKVFNLSMIQSQETIRRQPPNEELVKLLQRGNVTDYMEKENSICQANLFKLDNCKHKVILIEGAPGAGKSTLVWDICQKWKARKMYRNFQIVMYVQLRDPRIQSATSLTDLLPLESEESKKHVTNLMEKVRGIRTLFVLDGWDEYEPGLKQGSLFHKLICEPYMLQLHNSTVLITSRPIASRELQPYATSRVEILGFTQEEVRRYFSEALRDPAQVRNLYEQFKERPVIEASCYLPLNAAIIAQIFLEMGSVLPRTLHGVFSAVVCGCIRRYLKKQSGKDEEIPSLDQIPPYMQDKFRGICTLAYDGSMVNKVTFSGQELQTYGLSSEANVLDLMQVVPSFASRRSKLCHFLHLSVQELLTALKISKLAPPEQVQVFQDMFNNPRFAAVFHFYAAFTKLQTEGVRDIVVRIAQSREKQLVLNLMHCLYEAQDVSLCCFVASQLSVNSALDLHHMVQSPLDCLSVGYFLSCLYQYTSGRIQVKLTGSILGNVNFKFLAKGWSSSHVKDSSPNIACVALELTCGFSSQQEEDGFKMLLHCLKTNISVFLLKLCDCYPKGSGALLEEMLRENRTLQELDLSDSSIVDSVLVYVVKGLRHNTGLVKLSLPGCSVSGKEYLDTLLEEMLRENRTLQELDLSDISIADSVLGYVVKGLRHNTGLVKLSLPGYSVSGKEYLGTLLEEMLRVNRTLQELDLSNNLIDASALSCIAKGLRHNTGLVKLSLPGCSVSVTEDNGTLLVEMLKENRTLQELDLSHNCIGDNGLGYIAKGLRHNTGLVKLSLRVHSANVTKDIAPLLEEMLKANSTLEELDLSDNNGISTEGLLALGEGLRTNRGLKVLNLLGIHGITNKGWRKFVSKLKECNHLTKLYMSEHESRMLKKETDAVNSARQGRGLPLLVVTVAEH